MNQLMTNERLREENLAYVGTGGVSAGNRAGGFLPAFYDTESGRGVLARFADGRPAPMHLLDGVPEEWVVKRNTGNRPTALKATVISGFVRDGFFYTRAQAARAMRH